MISVSDLDLKRQPRIMVVCPACGKETAPRFILTTIKKETSMNVGPASNSRIETIPCICFTCNKCQTYVEVQWA